MTDDDEPTALRADDNSEIIARGAKIGGAARAAKATRGSRIDLSRAEIHNRATPKRWHTSWWGTLTLLVAGGVLVALVSIIIEHVMN